jgi:DNA polymerase-1
LQEEVIWGLVRQVHKHPNARVFGQNFLYDAQYFHRFFFLAAPWWFDTMVAHHCTFPGMEKSLGFLASLHCEHYVYWKDDGKEWDKGLGEEQLWTYNCDDCVNTYEIMESQWPSIEANPRLHEVWNFQQNRLVPRLFEAMNRGVRVNARDKAKLAMELRLEITSREEWIQTASGQPLNIKSNLQMKNLFYEDMRFKPIINRKTGQPTLDDGALAAIAVREPALRPFLRRIRELRSLGVFLSTFVEAQADRDGRMRSSYNPAGTDTFRLSSSTNAFWSGINFQNIPKGGEEDDHTELVLPNIRKLYIPDEGMIMFDMDLDRADLQVVVWEADDEELREALREGIDMHSLNAKTMFNLSCPLGDVKRLHNDKRQLAKSFIHGTNYGGGPRTMAKTCGLTIHMAEKLRARWFEAHPGIATWHKRTEEQLQTKRYVENRFGYRYTFFDRIEAALPQALAWVPQSTVGIVINRAWDQIMNRVPDVEVLIQVHDSLVGQFPSGQASAIIPQILDAARVTIPYEKPLIIPAGIATSAISWGDCK